MLQYQYMHCMYIIWSYIFITLTWIISINIITDSFFIDKIMAPQCARGVPLWPGGATLFIRWIFKKNERYIREAAYVEAVRKKTRKQSSRTITRPCADFQTSFFPTFQAIKKFFEKGRWMVTRQWLEVTRPSADCQKTFFRRFKQLEEFLKKVTERSRNSGRRSRDRRRLSNNVFWTFRAIRRIFEKVTELSRDSSRRSRDRRLTVK